MGTQLGLKGGDVAAIPLHRSRTSVQYTDAGEADRNGCSSLDLDSAKRAGAVGGANSACVSAATTAVMVV